MSRSASEIIVAEVVVNDLAEIGYDVYKEVSLSGGGSQRCDVYGVLAKGDKAGFTCVVEVKTSFNIKVIEQAYYWRPYAHSVYVAIPRAKVAKDRAFARLICKTFGIGVIEVDLRGEVSEIVDVAAINPTPKPPTLYEEQKSSVAGNADSSFHTPFSITVSRLVDFIGKYGAMPLLTAARGIDHHYKNHTSAANSLRKYIDLNVITELRTFSKGRTVWVEMTR